MNFEVETVCPLITQSGHFEPAIAAAFGCGTNPPILDANDKTNLIPDALDIFL